MKERQTARSVQRQASVHGLALAILDDGTPVLHERGLARLCGVAPHEIQFTAGPDAGIRVQLDVGGRALGDGEGPVVVYRIDTCLALLRVHGAASGPHRTRVAVRNLEILTEDRLAEFVTIQAGVGSERPWRKAHDGLTLCQNYVPAGYYDNLKELADLVALSSEAVQSGDDFGIAMRRCAAWGEHWVAAGLAERHGADRRYLGTYPSYLPGELAGLQQPFCYPASSLATFRSWLIAALEDQPSVLALCRREGRPLFPVSVCEIEMVDDASLPSPA